jgi:hypothetical protein
MDDILYYRFEHYFHHPDASHEVLQSGDRAPACRNIRRALRLLGIEAENPDSDLFDDTLGDAVRQFQTRYRHRVTDGEVGPGTRRLLVSAFVDSFHLETFKRLPEQKQQRSVFFSYASQDAPKIEPIEAWLSANGVLILRDLWIFKAGIDLTESIRMAIASADRVLAMLSRNSHDHKWPLMEWAFAEEVERHIKRPILLYVCLDETPLPPKHEDRLAIPNGLSVEAIGKKCCIRWGSEHCDPTGSSVVRIERSEIRATVALSYPSPEGGGWPSQRVGAKRRPMTGSARPGGEFRRQAAIEPHPSPRSLCSRGATLPLRGRDKSSSRATA